MPEEQSEYLWPDDHNHHLSAVYLAGAGELTMEIGRLCSGLRRLVDAPPAFASRR